MSDTDTQTDITDDSDIASNADIQKAAAPTQADTAAAPQAQTPEQLPTWDDVEKQHSQPEQLQTWDDVEAHENPSVGTAFVNLAKAEIPNPIGDVFGNRAEELSDAQRIWAMKSPIGNAVKAFGTGYINTFNQEVDAEAEEALKIQGIHKAYLASEDSSAKAFLDGTIVPAASELWNRVTSLGAIALNPVISGLDAATGKLTKDLVYPAMNEINSATDARVFNVANEDEPTPVSNAMEALGGDFGLFHVPEGAPEPLPTQLDRATANGTTLSEGIWDGTEQPTPAQAQVMQEAASRLPPTLHVDVPIPREVPTIHDVARQIDPETFSQYDQLNHERDMYSNMLNTIRDGRRADPAALEAQAPHTQEIADLQDKLENASARNAKRYQGQIDDLTEKNQAWIEQNKNVETPEMARLREAIQSTDEKIRDVAFDKETGQSKIKAAYDEAAKQVPQTVEPANAINAVEEQNPAAKVEETAPVNESLQENTQSTTKPIEDQKAAIAQDVSQKLVAAGRPQEEADASAQLIAEHYQARSERFNGTRGTAQEMYERDGADIKKGREVASRPKEFTQKPRELEQSRPLKVKAKDEDGELRNLTFYDGKKKIGVSTIYKKDAETAHLESVYVDQSVRGRGLGSSVLDQAIEQARDLVPGLTHIETEITNGRILDMLIRRLGNPETLDDGLKERNIEEAREQLPSDPDAASDEITGHKIFARFKVAPELKTDTPEFKNWFGDSKVIDKDGEPLVVYHGTNADIESFAKSNRGGLYYLAKKSDVANRFSEGAGLRKGGSADDVINGQNVMPVYVKIERPAPEGFLAKFDKNADYAQELRNSGYDGAITNESVSVIDSSQIKSVFNKGTFDPTDPRILYQQARGKIRLATDDAKAAITLFKSANASTFIHETGHHWLDELIRDAADEAAPDSLKQDADTVRKWLRVSEGEEIARRQHEKFARGFERYMMEGVAPSQGLARVFEQFKSWLTNIYQTVSRLKSPITDDIRGVFDRLLSSNPERQTIIAPEQEPGHIMANIHEEDARTTPPEKAAPVRDNVEKEVDLTAERHDPEVENVITGTNAKTSPLSGTSEGNTGDAESGQYTRAGSVAQELGAVTEGGDNAGGNGGATRAEQTTGLNTGAESGIGNATGNDGTGAAERRSGDKLVDKAGNIRLENLTNNEDVRSVMRDMADQNFDIFNHGVVTDREVSDLAQAMGVAEKEINLKKLQQAARADGIPLAVRIKVGRQMLVQSAQEAMEAMRNAANGGDAELQALAEARRRHLMIAETVSSITNEWGRAGRAFQDISKDTLQNAETVTDLFQKMTGLTPKQMKKMAEKGDFLLNESDQALAQQKMAKYLQDSTQPTFGDKIVEYRTNMLISGPITHARYAVGNFINAIWDPLVNTPIAATIGAAREAVSGEAATDRVQFGEIGAQLYAIGKGSADGLKAAVQAWKDERSPALPGEKFPTDQPVHSGAISGNLGVAIRIPGRSVSAIHSFFKQLRYEQNIAALSFRQAMSEGLEGDAFHGRIAELTQSPTEEMMNQATSDALKSVYMAPTKYDSFSGRMQAAINKNPVAKCLVPFMKIGTQIESQALLEGTPLGLLNKDIREGMLYKKGGAEGDMAVAKVAAGIGLMGATVGLAAQGLITGDGPTDPMQRNRWLLNHKPNTIQIGGIAIPYKGLGYLGTQMRFAANMYETAHGWGANDGDSLARAFLVSGVKSVLDDNWMYSVKSALDAVFDNEKGYKASSFIKSFATSWLPYSVGFHQVSTIVDPYMRNTQTIFDAARANIPYESESLFPRRDIFGNPIPNGGSIENYKTDPVVQRMDALQVGVGRLHPKIRGVPLTEAQYDDYSRIAGRLAKQRLDGIVPQDGFSQMPAESQIKTIKKIIESSRESARTAIMMQNPEIIQKAQELKTKH